MSNRNHFGRCAVGAIVAAAMAAAASVADAALIGGGANAAGGTATNASAADTGERLNVSRTTTAGSAFTALSSGTYNVQNFAFDASAATGTVRPFLAVLTDATTRTYQTVWVGPAVTVTTAGVVTTPYTTGTQQFTLAAAADVYAGEYTDGGGRVDYVGTGSVDHFGGTFTAAANGPTTAGQPVAGFTNANLGRTYAFEVNVQPVPEPASAGAIALAGVGLLARRRRTA